MYYDYFSVDWASLAQQWIKMKESMGDNATEALLSESNTNVLPVVTPPAPTAPLVVPPPPETVAPQPVNVAGWNDSSSGGQWWDGNSTSNSQPGWNTSMGTSGWYQDAPPPPPPPAPTYSYQPNPPPPPQFSSNSQVILLYYNIFMMIYLTIVHSFCVACGF